VPECAALREAQMVGVCRPAPTDQTRLFGHEPDMLPVTYAARLRMRELQEIASSDGAANWASRILGTKNSLTEADARQVENA
jgi:hypothetical protein